MIPPDRGRRGVVRPSASPSWSQRTETLTDNCTGAFLPTSLALNGEQNGHDRPPASFTAQSSQPGIGRPSVKSIALPPPSPVRTWPGRETRDQAERLNDQNLHVLLPRLPAVGRALLQCDGKHHRCWRPVCAVCARDYRPDPIAQLHALAQADPGPHQVATIYLALFPPGSLGRAELRRTREMLRKRLDRAGFKGAIVAGGIEVAWQENHQRWLLHAQVLAIGVAAQAWEQLEAALEKSGTADPVRPVALCNPDEQLSYCIKFVTYHQPGRRVVPLPGERLVELAAWWSRHRFEDFLFAYGARRRGGCLVVDE